MPDRLGSEFRVVVGPSGAPGEGSREKAFAAEASLSPGGRNSLLAVVAPGLPGMETSLDELADVGGPHSVLGAVAQQGPGRQVDGPRATQGGGRQWGIRTHSSAGRQL